MCRSGANFWKNTYAVDRPLKCFLVYFNSLSGKLVLKIFKPVSTTNWQACCCERGARCLFSPLGWSEWPAFGMMIARCLASYNPRSCQLRLQLLTINGVLVFQSLSAAITAARPISTDWRSFSSRSRVSWMS